MKDNKDIIIYIILGLAAVGLALGLSWIPLPFYVGFFVITICLLCDLIK